MRVLNPHPFLNLLRPPTPALVLDSVSHALYAIKCSPEKTISRCTSEFTLETCHLNASIVAFPSDGREPYIPTRQTTPRKAIPLELQRPQRESAESPKHAPRHRLAQTSPSPRKTGPITKTERAIGDIRKRVKLVVESMILVERPQLVPVAVWSFRRKMWR